MDPLSDLLSKKADALFLDDTFPQNEVPKPEATAPSPTPDIPKLKTMIHSMKDQLDGMLRVLDGHVDSLKGSANVPTPILATGERILEGVFTGDKMLGDDGKEYAVPPNYASKSKLVEGDMMKLTITVNGSFIYKQIAQAERIRVTGELVLGEHAEWRVLANGKPYKILTASATFYKGVPGDDVVILIPKDGDSTWGAVENIIHKS